jgi:hypothetical protein
LLWRKAPLLVLVAPCRCALSSKSAIICIVFFSYTHNFT